MKHHINRTETERGYPRVSTLLNQYTTIWIALVIALVGCLFMIGVGVNQGLRFGFTWKFDAIHSSNISVLVGSVAGALFALTNALLLYATLQAQNRAQVEGREQYREQRQDRNYDRLSDRTEKLEASIASYVVHWGPHMDHLIPGTTPFIGYSGLAKTFELWNDECAREKVEHRLTHGEHIDPDTYLTQQVAVMDIMHQLASVIQAIHSSDLDYAGNAYLGKRVNNILVRLSRSKNALQVACASLRQMAEEGSSVRAKQDYASNILHLESKIRDIEGLLPELPYRRLSVFETATVVFSAQHSVAMFKSASVPSIQVDGVVFNTRDEHWALRFNLGRLTVRIQASDGTNKQLNYLHQTFSFGALLYAAQGPGSSFDTHGQWFIEGNYNLLGATVEDHKQWRVDFCLEGVELGEGEEIRINVHTNAVQLENAKPISPFGASA